MTQPSSPLPPDEVDPADWTEQQLAADPVLDTEDEGAAPVPADLTTAEANEADVVEQLTEVQLDDDE